MGKKPVKKKLRVTKVDEEIKNKLVASYRAFSFASDGLIETYPGWTWIVEPEGYAACVSEEEIQALVGKTLKVLRIGDSDIVMEIQE